MRLLKNPRSHWKQPQLVPLGVESHFLNQMTVPNVSSTYGRNRPYSYE